jgi:hypothetical protein
MFSWDVLQSAPSYRIQNVILESKVSIVIATFFLENAKEFASQFIEQEGIRGTTSKEEGHTNTHNDIGGTNS